MILPLIIGGLASGSVYSLVALGLVWLHRSYGVMNFAHGEMALFVTYLAFFLVQAGWPMPLVFFAALLAAAILGAGVERALLRPFAGSSPLSLVIVTMGLLMAINGLASGIWGTLPQRFPPSLSGPPVRLGSWPIQRQDLLILGVVVLAVVALFSFLLFTKFGLASRAAVQNPWMARLLGVSINKVYGASWAVSVALGALAGILFAPKTVLTTSMMMFVLVKGFTAGVLGGFNSLPGAILGGLFLGITENLVAFYLSTQWKDSIALALIVLVLLARPEGLLGKKEVQRV